MLSSMFVLVSAACALHFCHHACDLVFAIDLRSAWDCYLPICFFSLSPLVKYFILYKKKELCIFIVFCVQNSHDFAFDA